MPRVLALGPRFRAVLPIVLAGLCGVPVAGVSAQESDGRLVVLRALEAELARARDRLQLPGEEKPYFVRFLVRDYDERQISARFGAILEEDSQRGRQAAVEVRVGDYQFDNTSDDNSERMFDFDDFERYQPSALAPIDNDIPALRATLWLLADARYKSALAALHKKRGRRATTRVEDETLPSFARAPAVRAIDPIVVPTFDLEVWRGRLRRLSARFKQHPDIFDADLRVSMSHQTRTIVTSEGTALINERVVYALHMQATTLAENGLLINHGKSFYGAREDELPDEVRLVRTLDLLVRELNGLRRAEMLDPYNGPAILLPEAAGVFFHEALGHRLEGERQNSHTEGATFKGQIGKPILPSFLTIRDDPTRRALGSVSLNGYYRFDDEGVPAQAALLVENGILRGYLMSRTPVQGVLESNGHGRAEGSARPIGRMANTIVESKKTVPYARLKQMLLSEIRRQKKDFGLVIADITGGQTNTTSYDFQAFKGVPRIVYRVDARTGAETLVKGVEFVGTPIGSLNRIVATSDEPGVFNGYCGAESGFIPVSTVAPAILISEIELQRTRRELERAPILPPPWADTTKADSGPSDQAGRGGQ